MKHPRFNPDINPRDWKAAARIADVSKLCVRYPNTLGRLIVGPYPVEWHLTHSHMTEIPNWQVALGDEHSGQLPRSYRSAALLTADRVGLRGLAEYYKARAAVAFNVGDAVLAAELPEWRPGAQLPDNPDDLGPDWSVIMGVGRDPLSATMGVLTQSNHFIGMGDTVSLESFSQRPSEVAAQYPLVPVV